MHQFWIEGVTKSVTDIDATAAEMLTVLDDDLENQGIVLYFAEINDPVKNRLKVNSLISKTGLKLFFTTLG
jgi:hypothetical protein